MSSFDVAYELIPGNGWLYKDEARLLWMASSCVSGPILEVGSYMGRSTCLLAQTGRPVFAVDPFDGFHTDFTGDEIHKAFLDNLSSRNLLHNVTLFRMRIEDVDLRLIPSVGLAYLDGDHTYKGTLAQINAARKLEAKVVAVHDVNDDGDGLQIRNACLLELGPWTYKTQRLAVWMF